MICPYCGNNLMDGIRFCPACGGQINSAAVGSTNPSAGQRTGRVIAQGGAQTGNGAGTQPGSAGGYTEVTSDSIHDWVNGPKKSNLNSGFFHVAGDLGEPDQSEPRAQAQPFGEPKPQAQQPFGQPQFNPQPKPEMQYNQPLHDQSYNQPQFDQPQYNQPQFDQPQYDQPQYDQQYDAPQKSGNATKLILIISICVLVLAAGAAAFIFLRGGNPKDISAKAVKAYEEGDYDTLVDCTSDSLYQTLYDRNGNYGDYDAKNGKDLKESLKNKLNLNGKKPNKTYSYVSEKSVSKSELKECLSDYFKKKSGVIYGKGEAEIDEFIDLMSDYDDFCLIEYTNNVFDICYKDGGKWYSTLILYI